MQDEERLGSIPFVFYLGIVLYVLSFFLVAVDEMHGWQCALITLTLFRDIFRSISFYPGLINPLIIAFVIMRLLNEAPRLRLIIAIAAILLFIPTWMVVQGMSVKLGCAMWVVSILLITAGEIGSWKPGSFRKTA